MQQDGGAVVLETEDPGAGFGADGGCHLGVVQGRVHQSLQDESLRATQPKDRVEVGVSQQMLGASG